MILVLANFIFNICLLSLTYLIGYTLLALGHNSSNISIWIFIGIAFISEFLLVLISFSKLAHFIIRYFLGARYLTTREKNLLEPIIYDAINLAALKIEGFDLKFSDLHIMIHDRKEAFAQSIGNDTILVSDGLLKNYNSVEIQGVVAHEIAHLFYNESQIFLTLILGNLGFMLFDWLYWQYLKFWKLTKYFIVKLDKTGFFNMLYYLLFLPLIIFSPIIGVYWIGSKIFDLAILFFKRKFENRADEFTKKLGLADGLISFLETQALITEHNNTIIGRLTSNHPPIMERIEQLEQS